MHHLGGHEFAPVEVDREHLGGDEIDPGRRTGLLRTEGHGRRRREVMLAGGEVKIDVVAVDGDQLAALGGLCTGHVFAHGVILADPSGRGGSTFAA